MPNLNTRKFSEFFAGGDMVQGNEPVGLEGGVNTIWNARFQFLNPGDTASRPVSPNTGDIRFNTDLNEFEYWDGSNWVQLAATGGFIPANPPTTDNAIVRWDGVNGDSIQNSDIIIDDSNNLTNNNTATFLWGTATAVTNSNFHIYNSTNGIISSTNENGDTTAKDGIYCVPHYTNAEEPFGVIRGATGVSSNIITIGGGVNAVNAATEIDFYTASNHTTINGTRRGRIDSSGNFLWNTTTAATNSNFNIHNSTNGIFTATSNTNDTTAKNGYFCINHYDNSEEPAAAVGARSTATENLLNLGGGTVNMNAATEILFITAANNTTTLGTTRGRINNAGQFLWNNDSPAVNSNFNINNAPTGIMTLTNSTSATSTKTGIYSSPHYDYTEEPVVGMAVISDNSNNDIRIGGGNGNVNAATRVRIYSAANDTTTTGTEVMRVTPDGWSMNGGTDFFDVYEEKKSHTPTASFATPGTSSFAYTTHDFEYNITGNKLEFFVALDFTPTIGTGSGQLRISLPNTSSFRGGGSILVLNQRFTWNSRTSCSIYIPPSANYFNVYTQASGQTTYAITASDMTTGQLHQVWAHGVMFI
jgi:hypothetical protein